MNIPLLSESPKKVESLPAAQSQLLPKAPLQPSPEPKPSSLPPVVPVKQQPSEKKASIDDEALSLVKKFVDANDTSISWQEFAQKMADIFQKDEKYKPIAQAFKDLTNSTFTTYIGYKLSWHAQAFPPNTYNFLQKFSSSELASLTSMRIKLNKK